MVQNSIWIFYMSVVTIMYLNREWSSELNERELMSKAADVTHS